MRDTNEGYGVWVWGKCFIPKLLHCKLFKSDSFLEKMELYLMCAIFGDKYVTHSNYSILLSSIISIYYVFHNEGEHAGCI